MSKLLLYEKMLQENKKMSKIQETHTTSTTSDYRLDRAYFLKQIRDIELIDFHFESLRGHVDLDMVLKANANSSLELRTLKKIITETIKGWRKSLEKGAAIIQDSPSKLLDYLTRPGAVNTVLNSKDGEFLGYGLLLTDPKHFPEKDKDTPKEEKIPEELLKGAKVSRGLRLFITDEGRKWGPFRTAVDRIMQRHIEIADIDNGGRIVINVQVKPKEHSYPWALRTFFEK